MPTMNFVDGEIAAENGAPVFVGERISIPLAADSPGSLAGRKVTLGVRSEHVVAGSMTGKVRLIEPLGDSTLVFFDCGTRLVAKVDPDSSLRPGEELSFGFDPANCHLFDRSSGES